MVIFNKPLNRRNLMKYPIFAAAFIVAASFVDQASAVDITFSDPHDDKSFSGVNLGANGPENNTVQYNAVANQSWDLEQFDLTGSNLAITGGFNYLTGVGTGSSAIFPMGDIFVYLGNEAPYSVPSAGDHDGPWTGRDDWNYVIHFDRGNDLNIQNSVSGVGYSILAKANQTINYTGGPSALNTGLPWYVTDASVPSSYAVFSSSLDGEGTHYTIGGINISSILDDGQPFYLHATMRCGNDVLWGYSEGTSRVPDGGVSLGLFGIGVSAIGLLRRRIA